MTSPTAPATTVPRPTDAPAPIVSPRHKTGAPAPAAAPQPVDASPQPADASSPTAAPRQTRAPSPAGSPRPAGAPSPTPPRLPASERPPELPGCRPFHLPASQLDTWESRIEVWDGRTETAWVCEPATIYHEQPTRRLAKVTERIAQVRGSPIESFGSADLLEHDASGGKRWIMQADEVLYLHPGRARISKRWVEIGVHDLPDVVLEVDHTTDVRLWKLGKYQEWGFPEIWVLVPWEESKRAPGLDIHVRGPNGGYRVVSQSVAFPGWKAEEIHVALTEEPLTAETYGVLERVGRALGAREGTRPEDDPFARSLSARAREEGHLQGAKGAGGRARVKGRAEGREVERASMVLAILRARGIAGATDLAGDRALLGGAEVEALTDAALACTGAKDFRRRVREASRAGGAEAGRQGGGR